MRARFVPSISVAAVLLALLPPTAKAATLVVNPALAGANDGNPGSDTAPLRTIGRAAAMVGPGDVVRIHSGVYRERVRITRSGTREQPIRFEAAPGADVVVTGVDPLTGWRKDAEGVYSTAWLHKLPQTDGHTPGGVEQVVVAGSLLGKVADLREISAKTFFVDSAAKRLVLKADRNPDDTAAQRPIEAATRTDVWIVTGSDVQTRGLRFRYAANRGQQGMAQFHAARAVIEDCVFEDSNSSGAFFGGEDIVVRRCTFRGNGQQGFSASLADRFQFDGCTVDGNNVKGYPRGWEAGGDKIARSRGVVIQNSRFLRNHGVGVWFDISNVDCTVRNCLIADNEDAGIFYEISYGLRAHDNAVIGNGLAATRGAWGANGGICVSSSPGCVIQRNLIVGNQQGFCFREQIRTTLPIGGAEGPETPVWVHDEVIRDNLIGQNRTAQVQGWFDIATQRHWPKAMQTAKVESGKPKTDVAAGFQARKDGVPPGLSLEDLKITFAGNFYALQSDQPLFIWGANWKRKQRFDDLAGLTKTLGFEDPHSRTLPPLPVDVAARDLRLPKDIFAVVERAYPQGPIPDCVLGAR